MSLACLEGLKKLPRMPTVIERYCVGKARKALAEIQTSSTSRTSTLWVDVSVISRWDAGSGIQRVVRSLVAEMQTCVLDGWRIQPVAATPGESYRATSWQMSAVNPKKHEKIEPQAGDIFLGLDLSAHIIPHHQKQMQLWKSRGVKQVFVIYDLLPLQHPEWFSARLVRAFRRWIRSVAILADQVFCISQQVRSDFEQFMLGRYGMQPGSIEALVFPMGSDVRHQSTSSGLPDDFSIKLHAIRQGRSALMVGTVEPRKGHEQILEVFERLWDAGYEDKLLIVGKPGWMTKNLQRRIRENQRLNDRLFWFDNASDEVLNALYENCTGVIVASYAEGYGLPLIEALGRGKPVLARDLPVFHQFQTPQVSYFPSDANSGVIESAVQRWLENAARVGQSDRHLRQVQIPTWRDSLNSLLGQLLPEIRQKAAGI